MSIQLEKNINNSFPDFQAGTLERFTRQILPLMDSRYKELKPHGVNREGKTKPGTPDLIKTFNDGSQIAVQCSTRKDYWKLLSSSNPERSKPIEDINKCQQKLFNLEEVVLVSNRPFNNANDVSIIRKYSSNCNLKISLYTSEDFASFIAENSSNPEIKEIIKDFFPDIYQGIYNDDLYYKQKGGDS